MIRKPIEGELFVATSPSGLCAYDSEGFAAAGNFVGVIEFGAIMMFVGPKGVESVHDLLPTFPTAVIGRFLTKLGVVWLGFSHEHQNLMSRL